ALRDATVGHADDARQEATAALSLRGERTLQSLTALSFAQIGDSAKAQKMIDDLSREFPSDTFVNSYFRPVVLGLIALQRNNPAEAISAVEPYRKYAMGSGPDLPVYWFWYVRGQAFLRQKDGAKAAAEFQTILDHRGLEPTSELYPLAQLNMARAYAMQGDMTKARTAYQDFFALWKDADEDLPVLREAKAEYGKLK
ncbi:MAG: tetratricopeptide repeat protein, partial [Candidatus Acidiferrales bacterium]